MFQAHQTFSQEDSVPKLILTLVFLMLEGLSIEEPVSKSSSSACRTKQWSSRGRSLVATVMRMARLPTAGERMARLPIAGERRRCASP